MNFTPGEVSAYFHARMPALKQNGRQWRAACPVHNGKGENFSVDAESGASYCHSQCQRGWDLIALEMELSSASFVKAKAAVFETVGRPKQNWEEREIEAVYDYLDTAGNLVYQVVRRTGKRFTQRRPGPGGKFISGLGDVAAVPFQLPMVARVDFVAIVEGERDAVNLTRAGIIATCNNGGAGNFKPELVPYFSGKHIVILPDNDEPGRKHAMKVAAMLAPGAASVRIVEITGLPAKGDVSDFLARGGTKEQLLDYVERASDWNPEWKFLTEIPDEDDRYVASFGAFVERAGGMDAFWAPPTAQGVETPWPLINTHLAGGMRADEVYVLGGNQGSGKTSLGLQFIKHAILRDRGVLMFSMEMSHRDVFQRMASADARIDLTDLRRAQKSDPMATGEPMRTYLFELQKASWALANRPLLVSTRSRVTPDYLVKESKRLMARQRIHLVVVDHMQLMGANTKTGNEYEKFTAISRVTKEVAKELHVPLLLISQTTRNSAHEKRLELDLEDLRGSGAIEEDAAAVFLLYEDKDDREASKRTGRFSSGPLKTWLKIAKNRYGPSGCYLPLLHFKRYTRFDLESDRED